MEIISLEKSHSLTQCLWSSEQIRMGERRAAKRAGISLFELMTLAGQAVFEHASANWPQARCWWIVTGSGNNAGDGYVVARLAIEAGIEVHLIQAGDAQRLTGDAAKARDQYCAQGGTISQLDTVQASASLIIDALLGTGLVGPLSADAARHIRAINQHSAPVLAVDLPSGLCADTGQILTEAVTAAQTLCVIGLKIGLLTARGPDVTGKVFLADLGMQSLFKDEVGQAPIANVMHWQQQRELLPVRRTGAHKGEVGRVLVAGGHQGMSGAIRLTGEAALRCGSGLVRLVSHNSHAHLLNMVRPELMTAAFPDFEDWQWAGALVLGPGLGRDSWSQALFNDAIASNQPMVIDADALWWLAKRGGSLPAQKTWVLTPHSGEAATLLQCKVSDIEADRLAAVQAIQQQYGAVVVLKGAGSLIADEHNVRLCHYGNSGMASGGMGDLLSGIIRTFLAQGLTTFNAASLAVCLHALAGDMAATQQGMRGLLASDLLPQLRSLINQDDDYDHRLFTTYSR
ncbi:NAD(P)H-hydrate dehydratase [Oceanisphaera pacifica]|uniref:Bifunctional NAD(P)H-hydrate repair enzyme n=1 Tax=Oceanisphaera pacifica TaxID=2818389 RepID=A0ABS3NC09_9GAMM|nr:NAD(P)H-hydrate dehydratase [Oceanisphaera pacifica]MBO1518060.1 NAD(P)H-hydrate dehydratase [Oceanisphaera pacifica]